MVYLNGNYDYETLAEYAVDAFIEHYYSDLKEEGTLTQVHAHEAKQELIKTILGIGWNWPVQPDHVRRLLG